MRYNSKFYQMITESSKHLQWYVDKYLVEKYKDTDWKKTFRWDVEASEDGVFEHGEIIRQQVTMADGREKWSETSKRDTHGVGTYLGKTFNFGIGMEETGQDLERYEKIAKNFGDVDVIKQFTINMEDLVSSVHARLTNMANQMESTGKVIVDPANYGVGYQADKLPIPNANELNAASGAWSAASAKPITDMMKAEKHADEIGMPANRVWRIPVDLQTAFLTNAEVKSYIKMFLYPSVTNAVADMMFSVEDLNKFLIAYGGRVSRIEWVDSVQKGYARDGSISNSDGWATGIAVLRPAGLVGTVKYDRLAEVDITRKAPNASVATLEGGRIGVIRKSYNDPKWKTDVITSAVPVLDNWNKYILFNTNPS